MEEIKKKRGRPRKNPTPEIPQEIQSIIEEVQQKQEELQQQIEEERIPKRYVHGVVGIKQLFNCSYPTAHKLKETILKPAIKQQGRVIVVDADLALKLFSEHEQIKSVKALKVK